MTDRDDYAGIGLNWGRAHESNRDQLATELFYRWQLAKNLGVTPNAQLVVNPAFNPDQDSIWFLSLMARATFWQGAQWAGSSKLRGGFSAVN